MVDFPPDPEPEKAEGILLSDANRILPNMPDKSVDLIITDPMYGEALDIKLLERICRGNIIVFADSRFEPFQPDERHYWCKPPSPKNNKKRAGNFVEHILIRNQPLGTFVFNGPPAMHWSNYRNWHTDTIEGPLLHEFQKPLALIERLVLLYSKPGDMILDPYCGSGTTIVAARRNGRRASGIEYNREVYLQAVERVKLACSNS